ncbi:MAG: cation transporting ATPase C-terminal domain-containing protein [Verrucomicrobiales bacterium]|nr:cation transporting ATPase C-terminal domain-containing protein [Verrucomicrobiales bacterium]
MRTGLITSIMIGGAYWMFFHEFRVVGETLAEARTAVVNVIVMVEVAYLFSCRSLHRSVFRIGFWTNPYVIMGAAAMIVAQMFFTYAPAMNHLFHSTPLSLERWGRILGVALSSFLAVELEKWIRFGGSRRGRALPE